MIASKAPFYFLATLAGLITLTIGFKNNLFWLAFFAFSPYVMTLILLYIASHQTAILTAKVMTVFLLCVGLYFLLDTTYMERALGDKFSFYFLPLWQWTMLLVSGFVIYLSNADPINKG